METASYFSRAEKAVPTARARCVQARRNSESARANKNTPEEQRVADCGLVRGSGRLGDSELEATIIFGAKGHPGSRSSSAYNKRCPRERRRRRPPACGQQSLIDGASLRFAKGTKLERRRRREGWGRLVHSALKTSLTTLEWSPENTEMLSLLVTPL